MDPHPLAILFKRSNYDEPIASEFYALDYLYEALLKIENFMFGSNNKDRRTSHNDKVNDLTHEQTKKGRAKERGRRRQAEKRGDWEIEGE